MDVNGVKTSVGRFYGFKELSLKGQNRFLDFLNCWSRIYKLS
jgi:hypothetical protein